MGRFAADGNQQRLTGGSHRTQRVKMAHEEALPTAYNFASHLLAPGRLLRLRDCKHQKALTDRRWEPGSGHS